ncbi:MAG: hypothetical protein ACLPTJ_05070, partial [Solirubrobacteraceae bacterium]
ARLQEALGAHVAQLVARTHADIQLLARGDRAALERLRLVLRDSEPICLADRESDVHDVGALVDLHHELFSAVT